MPTMENPPPARNRRFGGPEAQATVDALGNHLDLAHDRQLGAQARRHGLEGDVGDADRLFHHRQGARPQRVHGDVQLVVVHIGRHHHDGGGAPGHDLQGGVQAVHPRQADVKRDDVGVEGLQQLETFLRGLDRGHDLEPAVASDDMLEQLADDQAVLHDEHPDLAHRICPTVSSSSF
jgi:hypothetical protein